MSRVPAPERRRLPYPYRALLAICSDLDETPDACVYLDTLRFLNTEEETPLGKGLGLEVGNTIYFDMPPGHVSYWNVDEGSRASMRALMRSGHIDCLHSFGDLATTRAHAARALDELERHGCRLEVWIDHAVAPSNFGADIMRGFGDVPGSPVYHADLSTAAGIRYVWRGRVTSVIGQDVPRRLGGIFDPRQPLKSARTVLKEARKGALGSRGDEKYGMHGPNTVLRPAKLRSGHAVHEFLRANPHPGGVSTGETADGVGEALRPSMIDRLIAREGTCVLYTHLGKTRDARTVFDAPGRAALEALARAYREGRVLVTTTRRLLGYTLAAQSATWTATREGQRLTIDIQMPAAETIARSDIDGLTFYVDEPGLEARIRVDGTDVPTQSNAPDHTGRASVSIPRSPLAFPTIDARRQAAGGI